MGGTDQNLGILNILSSESSFSSCKLTKKYYGAVKIFNNPEWKEWKTELCSEVKNQYKRNNVPSISADR